MITKLRKAQDSWLSKAVLGLTALSFMSLFGVSGYLSRAAENPAVIKVGSRKLSLGEFNAQVENQIRIARRLFGDDIEISDEMRNAIAGDLVQKDLSDMIVKETATDKRIYVSDGLVRGVIWSQPQFTDADGKFSRAAFQNFLSSSNWTEQKYIDTIRTDIAKSLLVANPIGKLKVSKTLADLTIKSESQQKIFKYIEINPQEVKIDRQMTDEELEQYYNDFSNEFVEPETRDITVLNLTFDKLADKVNISEDEIKEFYNSHIDNFVVPEQREVLQMIFTDEEKAKTAFDAVKGGADFYETADKLAEQTREETELGFVSKDMLIAEIADDVFSAQPNDILGPVESELGWHIMQLKSVKAGSKVDDQVAREQIIKVLRVEKAYDQAYDIVKDIDDKIGAGAELEDVASAMNLTTEKVNSLTDEASSTYAEAAFSYNQGEISQPVETDDGFVFVRVDKVNDAHQQDMATARNKIIALWQESERSAIAQEIINDVLTDMENGDKIEEIAKRYTLEVKTTEPVTRNSSFAGLTSSQIRELFNEKLNTARQFTALDGQTVIAVADSQVEAKTPDDSELEKINRRLSADVKQQAEANLISDYGHKYEIRVKYRQLGLAD